MGYQLQLECLAPATPTMCPLARYAYFPQEQVNFPETMYLTLYEIKCAVFIKRLPPWKRSG